MLERLLFAGLLVLIVWAPLPVGSYPDWAASFLCGITYTLAVGWLVLYAHGRTHFTGSFIKARGVLLLMGFSIIWVFCQSLPVSMQYLSRLSPRAAEIYERARFVTPELISAVSVDPYRTYLSAVRGLAYLLLFALVLLLARSDRRIKALVYVIVLSGVFQAFYGSVLVLSGHEKAGLATGSFANRNRLAGYLEMCLAVGIGILIGSRFSWPGGNWRDWLRSIAGFLLSEKAPLRIGVVVMAIALVLTRSRMGNVSFVVSLSIAGLAYLFLARSSSARTLAVALLASIAAIDILIMGSYFGIEKVARRLEQTTTSEVSNRIDLFDYAVPYARAYLPSGSGGGTFYTAFPPFSGPEVRTMYDHAHNDYLEFLGEWGILGVLPMAGAVVLCLLRTGRALYYDYGNDPLIRGCAFASMMGILEIGIHSMVDFNLQIPANASLFVILLAMAWLPENTALRSSKRKRSRMQRTGMPMDVA